MEDSSGRYIQAILFDLDGTLLDTSADFVHILNTMLLADNRPPLSADSIRRTVSDGSRGLVTLGYGLTSGQPGFDGQRQRLLEFYQNHTANPERDTRARLFQGIDTLLAAIESRDIPWGIVTNKPRGLTEPLLEQLGLSRRCSVLVCPDDVGRAKPHPEPLWLAAEQLACDAGACIYIGDHERDIQAGQAAGMATISALYGFIPANANPDDWRAEHAISQPLELLEWLDECSWSLDH